MACEVAVVPGVVDVAVTELARQRRDGADLFLLDVREPVEWAIGRIDGAELVPLGELSGSLDRLPRDREIVVYCKGGTRSAQAAGLLHQAGFPRVRNLVGGIAAWSREVDPSVPRY